VETADGHTLVNLVNGNLVGADPMLGGLADNGGPTRTHVLLPGSVAIDAGFNVDFLTSDQRGTGFPRTLGARTDIGAFETAGAASFIVAGATVGSRQLVRVYDSETHALLANIVAFEDGRIADVRVAVGDVNGDGVPDIIAAAGPGSMPKVKVFDGTNFTMISSFLAFGQNFRGGVYVAAGDVDRDGDDDIVVGMGSGARPRVRVLDFDNLGTALHDFNAYPDTFAGGVRVAAGDLNWDGFADIITGPGEGTRTRVKAFSGVDLTMLHRIDIGPSTYTGGAQLGAGDVDGDGHFDIIVGTTNAPGAGIEVFSGNDGSLIRSFNPHRDIVEDRVAGGNIIIGGIRDDRDDIIVGRGPTTQPAVKVFDGLTSMQEDVFLAFGSSILGGIFVGGY
jgi:hypothetical protein